VLSFNGNKIMTTSGGGALLTDDGKLAAQVRHLATQARQPVVWYEHTEIGYNYRLSNLLAALGRAQLLRLDSMITRRREVREGYRTLFAGMPGVELFGGAGTEDNAWLSAVVVDSAVAGWSAGQLGETLRKEGIETRPLWKPMHLQPVFSEARSWVNGNSERLFKTGLALPSGSSLSSVQRERVLGVINVFLREHAP
jgi:dTDP-4-amino-4,6-dideoxygalactose transaminase